MKKHRSTRRRTLPASNGSSEQATVWLSRPGRRQCEHLRPEQISDVLGEPGILLWVDVRDPGPAELAMLREEFGFHGLALEDVSKGRQRSKVDEYPGYFFVVMHAPLAPAQPGEDLAMAEIHLFVGRNYVVTAHHGEVPVLSEAMRRWERTEPELRDRVGFLVHTIADAVIDSYFPVVDAVEDRLDELELALFNPGLTGSPEELLAVKRTLLTLRKAVYPLREVFNVFLRRDQAVFSPDTLPYFQDVYDHVLRLMDTIEIQRDMATGALDAQLSVASNRLNETMRRLTVVAICVAIMGAVFGAWGMNFDEVPLHDMGLTGFAVLTGSTFALVGLALILARRYQLW